MRNQTIIVIILAVLLVLSVGYIGYGYYAQAKSDKQNELLQQQTTLVQQGAFLGYQQAFVDIASAATTCQPVPLFFGNSTANVTINMIAVDCLNPRNTS